jgi:DNA gyrase/topoisomerase IV subunit A
MGTYKGNTRPRSCDVGRVLVGKEFAQGLFLKGNSYIKKTPGNDDKENGVKKIAQNKLRADGPVVKAHVRRVPKDAVDAVRDQNVSVFLGQLNQVIKRLGRRRHGQRPQRLADGQYYQP